MKTTYRFTILLENFENSKMGIRFLSLQKCEGTKNIFHINKISLESGCSKCVVLLCRMYSVQFVYRIWIWRWRWIECAMRISMLSCWVLHWEKPTGTQYGNNSNLEMAQSIHIHLLSSFFDLRVLRIAQHRHQYTNAMKIKIKHTVGFSISDLLFSCIFLILLNMGNMVCIQISTVKIILMLFKAKY